MVTRQSFSGEGFASGPSRRNGDHSSPWRRVRIAVQLRTFTLTGIRMCRGEMRGEEMSTSMARIGILSPVTEEGDENQWYGGLLVNYNF